jgi:hypothetical protein
VSPATYATPAPYDGAPHADDLKFGSDATLEERIPARIGTAMRTMMYMLNLGYQGRYGA